MLSRMIWYCYSFLYGFKCIHVFQLYTTWFPISEYGRHQMETFSALLAICAGNSPVTGEFPAQRPVTRSFDVFFDLRPRLSKLWWGWWFETPSYPLWRHCNGLWVLYKWHPNNDHYMTNLGLEFQRQYQILQRYFLCCGSMKTANS